MPQPFVRRPARSELAVQRALLGTAFHQVQQLASKVELLGHGRIAHTFGITFKALNSPVPPFYSVLVVGKGLTRFEFSGRIGYDEPSQMPN